MSQITQFLINTLALANLGTSHVIKAAENTTNPTDEYRELRLAGNIFRSVLFQIDDAMTSNAMSAASPTVEGKQLVLAKTLAANHGAKFHLTPDKLWVVLDQPGTPLWNAYFRDEGRAAMAYCLHHKLMYKLRTDTQE